MKSRSRGRPWRRRSSCAEGTERSPAVRASTSRTKGPSRRDSLTRSSGPRTSSGSEHPAPIPKWRSRRTTPRMTGRPPPGARPGGNRCRSSDGGTGTSGRIGRRARRSTESSSTRTRRLGRSTRRGSTRGSRRRRPSRRSCTSPDGSAASRRAWAGSARAPSPAPRPSDLGWGGLSTHRSLAAPAPSAPSDDCEAKAETDFRQLSIVAPPPGRFPPPANYISSSERINPTRKVEGGQAGAHELQLRAPASSSYNKNIFKPSHKYLFTNNLSLQTPHNLFKFRHLSSPIISFFRLSDFHFPASHYQFKCY